MLCSTVSEKKPVCVDPSVGSGIVLDKIPVCVDLEVGYYFEPFIADTLVSLVGSDQRVPIKLLRDTGARHSCIVESVLPFSPKTEREDFVLMKGMEIGLSVVGTL